MRDSGTPNWQHARIGGLALCLLVLAGCQQEMARQPSYRPQQSSEFFPDGQASRPPVPGTVARDHLRDDPLLFAGKDESRKDAVAAASFVGFGTQSPLPVI